MSISLFDYWMKGLMYLFVLEVDRTILKVNMEICNKIHKLKYRGRLKICLPLKEKKRTFALP